MPSHASFRALSLCVSLLLLVASKGFAASTLNINLTPADGGGSTQVSWYFGGDIVSDEGAGFGSRPYSGGGIISLNPCFGFSFTGLLSESYPSASFAVANAGVVNAYSQYASPSNSVPIESAAISSININAVNQIVDIYTNVSYSLITGLPTTNSYTNIISQWTNQLELGLNSPTTQSSLEIYTPGVDSYIIPVSFSSFNMGTYNAVNNSYYNGFTAVATVVPEPSTYALIGFGAIGMLTVLRRKKTALSDLDLFKSPSSASGIGFLLSGWLPFLPDLIACSLNRKTPPAELYSTGFGPVFLPEGEEAKVAAAFGKFEEKMRVSPCFVPWKTFVPEEGIVECIDQQGRHGNSSQ